MDFIKPIKLGLSAVILSASLGLNGAYGQSTTLDELLQGLRSEQEPAEATEPSNAEPVVPEVEGENLAPSSCPI